MGKLALSALVLTLALAAPAGAAAAREPASAPDFTLPTLTGSVSLDSLRGKVVLVDFWASWCDPCRKSFPWLSDLQDRYAKKGLQVVAINLDKKRQLARAFLDDNPSRFLVAFDPDGKTAEAFHVAAMPSSFVIGPDGTVIGSHRGFNPRDTGELEALIAKECGQ